MPGEAIWKTDQLWLASFVAMHMEVLGVDINRGHCYWKFEKCSLVDELVLQFQNGNAFVEPQAYSASQVNLKKLMYHAMDAGK